MSMLLLMDGPSLTDLVRAMFAANEQGIWLDPSDFSTLFQDSTGTTPVTAVGQPVGKILDKSGRGNHATQSTAASRPTLQQDSNGMYYLAFDGTDDGMATPSIDFTGTDKMTVWAGVRKESDAAFGVVCELSPNSASSYRSFTLFAPFNNGLADYGWRSKGTAASTIASAAAFASPHKAVLTGIGDISGDSAILRVNGAQVASASTDQGTGNYDKYVLYIGRRGGTSSPLNGRIYQLIVRGAASSTAQIASTETYVNSKTGAY